MVPRTIDSEELLVRGVLTPLFFSSKKLKREAFLPPPNKADVSLLRHHYTDDNFCKTHSIGLKINNQTYCGLATILALHVNEVSLPTLTVEVKATPLDASSQIIEEGDIYKKRPGLPMHADLVYSLPTVKGQVSTDHRLIADTLLNISNYFPDPEGNAESIVWKGKPLCWEQIEDNTRGPKIQAI